MMKRLKLTVFMLACVFAASAQEDESKGYIVSVGDMAPDFVVKLDDGRSVQLSSLRGKVVMLQFTASWCGVCRKEMPLLSRWYVKQQQSRAKPKVSMMGVALDSEANIARFVQQTPVRYPLWRYSGTDSTAWMKTLGNSVGALPFTLVRAPQCGFQAALFIVN